MCRSTASLWPALALVTLLVAGSLPIFETGMVSPLAAPHDGVRDATLHAEAESIAGHRTSLPFLEPRSPAFSSGGPLQPWPRAPSPPASPGEFGSVSTTLTLFNNSLTTGDFEPGNGLGPLQAVVDPSTGLVYIPDQLSDNVTVLNGTSGQVVDAFPAGRSPEGVALASSGRLLVSDFGSNTVVELNETTGALLGSVYVGTGPTSIVYDPSNGEAYVIESGRGNVTAINVSTLRTNGNFKAGASPNDVVLDSGQNQLWVDNTYSSNVTVINLTSGRSIANLPLGSYPGQEAYDAQLGAVFIASENPAYPGTVTEFNDSNLTLVRTITVGSDPYGLAFDPSLGYLYAVNTYTQNLSVVNASSGRVLANVPLPAQPFTAVFDGPSDVVFEIAYWSSTVVMLSPLNGSVRSSASVGYLPYGAALVPTNHELFVPNNLNSSTSVVNGTTHLISRGIHGESGPEDAIYDPASGDVYVSNCDANTISVLNETGQVRDITSATCPEELTYVSRHQTVFVDSAYGWVETMNGSTNTPWSGFSVPGGYPLGGIGYDPQTDRVYIAVDGGVNASNLSVYDAHTLKFVQGIAVGANPTGIAYDPANSYLYVANSGSDNVSVVNATTGTAVAAIPVAPDPTGIAFDSANDYLIVTDPQVGELTLINGSENQAVSTVEVGGGPRWVVIDPATQTAFVGNTGAGSIDILDATGVPRVHGVDFEETGLVNGTTWSVTLGGIDHASNNSSVEFSEENGTYHWSVGNVPGFGGEQLSGTITVNGSSVTTDLNFTQVDYSVTVSEHGLPSGTEWWVNLTSGITAHSAAANLSFDAPNGSYGYSVSTANKSYAAPGGSLRVLGENTMVSVAFALVTFRAEFAEIGLPNNANWGVSIDGQKLQGSGDLSIMLANGSYSWTISTGVSDYSVSPVSGDFRIDGSPYEVNLTFQLVPMETFTVTFNESGLPHGTTWTVSLAGSPESSSGTTISFTMPNGSYAFAVSTGARYSPSPSSGTAPVQGMNLSEPIEFTMIVPPLVSNFTFHIDSESCLANGGVTNAVTLYANASGGTPPYTYAWTLPTGSATGAETNTTLTYGQNNIVTLAVSDSNGGHASHSDTIGLILPPCPYTPPHQSSSNTSSPDYTTWAIVGVVVAVVALGIGMVVIRRRGRDREPGGPPPSD
jgi:YVTN family beta-propeller protein